MLFNSHLFLFVFLPICVAGAILAARWSGHAIVAWLTACSIAFYIGGSPLSHAALLIGSVVANFWFGVMIHRSKARRPKFLLIIAVGLNLLLLGYFKYLSFFVSSLLGLDVMAHELPLGISFFTFTQIGYLVGAYRREVSDHSFGRYILFVTYFPHLIAGPILSHNEMLPQFARLKGPSERSILIGLSIFAFGLAKKTICADSIAPYADAIFGNIGKLDLTMAEAWFGALAYTMQIYFDFSAYSDMAVGISYMFGIQLPLNFNSPYKATTIIDFWRRWHMTLSRFLRDFLYIPLGGNRYGEIGRYRNLLVTMLLGGLWHGAGWTFIVWGGLHGLYLAANHLWQRSTIRMHAALAWPLTFGAVVLAWVFFRADNVMLAVKMLGAMFGANGIPVPHAMISAMPALGTLQSLQPGLFRNEVIQITTGGPILIALLAIALAMPNVQEMFSACDAIIGGRLRSARVKWQPTPAWAIGCAVVLVLAVLMITKQSPFLYFRF